MVVMIAHLLLAAVLSADPQAVITGPDEADPWQLVILDSSESVGDHRKWLVDTSDVDVPDNDDDSETMRLVRQLRALGIEVQYEEPQEGPVLWLMIEDGQCVVFAGYPGTYRVTLAVSNADGVALAQHTLVREGDHPDPDPRPDPNPDPPPPVPSVRADVSRGLSAILPQIDTGQFATLARSYDAVVQLVDDGAITTVGQLAASTELLIAATLDEQNDALWAPVIGPVIDRLRESGKVETVRQYRDVYVQIAAGIRDALGDDTDPDPDDGAPFPSEGLSVLIVAETGDSGLLASAPLIEGFEAADAEWRIFDPQTDVREPGPWRDALHLPRDSLPWLYVAHGNRGYSGPLPETDAETLQIVGRYK